MINPVLGFSTTLAIAMHEIPQEIGDYGVLIYAGFKRKNALFVNYLVALTVVIGGIVGYFSFLYIEGIIPYILPFAAGGFVYIASSDLIPEIRNEKSIKKSMLSMLVFIIGIMFMYFIK
jgi:zinc and cadmium transporter